MAKEAVRPEQASGRAPTAGAAGGLTTVAVGGVGGAAPPR